MLLQLLPQVTERHGWADSSQDTMYLYDSGGKIVRSVTVKKGVGIKQMIVKRSGEVIVSNRDQKVRILDKKGKTTTLIDTTPFAASGICLTETEQVVVCMTDQGDKNHVAIYSPDGRQEGE